MTVKVAISRGVTGERSPFLEGLPMRGVFFSRDSSRKEGISRGIPVERRVFLEQKCVRKEGISRAEMCQKDGYFLEGSSRKESYFLEGFQ